MGTEYIKQEVLNKKINQLLTIYLEYKIRIYYVWILLYPFHGIYTFYSLYMLSICVSISITSSAVGINIFSIFAGIKWYKSIIKKKKKKHDEIVLLGNDRLNTIKF